MFVLVLVCALDFPGPSIRAQALGPEFQVNTHTVLNQQRPAAAMALDGRFVVVWASEDQDGSEFGVFGQRYDNQGNPQGPEFQINMYTTGQQWRPDVAMDYQGNFVVVWESDKQDGDGLGAYGRRYDSDGNALGAEFQVNTTTANHQDCAAVAMNRDGKFVVTWSSWRQDGDNEGVFGQLYDDAGNTVGGEFQANTYWQDNQSEPAVAISHAGAFVVVWSSWRQDGSDEGVYGQRYDAGGSPLGSERKRS